MNFITELGKRLTSESPKFFKKLQNLGLYLSGAATAVLAVPGIPEKITEIASYVITAGLVLVAIAKLPVQNTDELKN